MGIILRWSFRSINDAWCAGVFLKLIDRVPELETTAYVLILIIASKMALTLVDVHIYHTLFFAVIILAFLSTFVIHHFNKKKAEKAEKETA